MNKKYLLAVLVLLFTVGISFAESTIKGNRICLYNDDFDIMLSASENNLLHVRVTSKGESVKALFFRVEKKVSPTVPVKIAGKFKIGDFVVEETENGFILHKNNKKLYSSSFTKAAGKLIEEKKCYDNELFFGMGEASDQFTLNRRMLTIYQEAEYGNQARLYIPFFFTNGGDAYYYNAGGRDTVKFRKKNESSVSFTTNKGLIDYYYYYEPNPKKLVSTFYEFSNSRSMLPKWAFGYIQSKFGYESEKEVFEVVNKFKKYQIPISAIVLDLQWFKHMGDLDYNGDNWPDPEKMDKFLEDNGIKLLTISEPFYTIDSRNYKEFEKNGLFAKQKDGKTFTWKDWWCFDSKDGAIVNPIAPKAGELVGSKYTAMLRRGIDAFWTDLGEPENVPADAYFNEYTEEEFHNFYNLEWTKLIYNAVKKAFPDKRLLILSRSGFTGSAGYGVSIWSGDSSSSFDGLAKQPVLGINSGLTGFSYWGSDVGGFESHKELPDEELFIRWMQFGAFSPVFRAHGAMSAREPWIHGEKALDIIRYFIRLRYKLLPYIYSTAYRTYKEGIPMMRPLFFEHWEDKNLNAAEFADQYYFGDFLLVAPVLEAAALEPEISVYLPNDTSWYDFYSFEKIPSGMKTFNTDIKKIPVYIKEGAILPMDIDGNPVILLMPGKERSAFTWYDDDGVSNRYQKGDFEAIDITLDDRQVVFSGVKKKKEVTLKIPKGTITLSKIAGVKEEKGFYIVKIGLKVGNNTLQFN